MFNDQLITLDQIKGTGSDRVYSENEFLTGGTWIDDRVIYSKVINHPNVTGNTEYSIPHGISNLGLIVSYTGLLKSENDAFQCSMELIDIVTAGSFFISGNNIVFSMTETIGNSFLNATFILEYVKETP